MDTSAQLWTALWMGFIGAAFMFVGVLLLWRAIQGDITFSEAGITWAPLAGCYLLLWAARGTWLSWVFGLAGLGYLVWITLRGHTEEKRIAEDLIAREIEKWRAALARDERNAGAHLYLGHALLQRGDREQAAQHYRRAMELDSMNARDVDAFLARRSPDEEAAVRALLPELGRILAEAQERVKFGKAVTPRLAPEEAAVPAVPEAEPTPPSVERPARQLLGYASEEERLAQEELYERLAELRQVLDASPDDVETRLAYARALEEANQPARARQEYASVLTHDPECQEAADALARLPAPPTP